MFKKILFTFLCLMTSLLQANEDKPMLVGTNAEFPPFTYIENGKIVGFDIDIATEVVKRLGKTIQFKDMPFEALIPEIILGHVDFAAAGLSYSEERAKRVSFTKSYITEDPLVILSASDQQKLSLEDLKGKKVIVIEGFTADLFMSSKEGVDLIRLPTQADGFMAMKSGRAAAFVTAKSTVDAFFEVQGSSNFHFTPIEGTSDTCALVVPKSKPQLLLTIQKALDEMETDGTLAQLKTKWKLK